VTITAAPIVTTTELVVNGSFEQDLTGWTQVEMPGPDGGTGSCGMNVATAPGTESVTGTPGFPATDGTKVLLSTVVSTNPNSHLGYECYVYQDVTIPAAVSTLTLTYDAATKDGNTGCALNGIVVAYNPDLNPIISEYCSANPDTSLTTMTAKLDTSDIAGTTVRLMFINLAFFQSHEIAGIDNIHLIAVSSK
jgi:hypothetical protein